MKIRMQSDTANKVGGISADSFTEVFRCLVVFVCGFSIQPHLIPVHLTALQTGRLDDLHAMIDRV